MVLDFFLSRPSNICSGCESILASNLVAVPVIRSERLQPLWATVKEPGAAKPSASYAPCFKADHVLSGQGMTYQHLHSDPVDDFPEMRDIPGIQVHICFFI